PRPPGPARSRGRSRARHEREVVPRLLPRADEARDRRRPARRVHAHGAVRRPGTDLGIRDAWIFFSHPYAVFPKDAVFWNAPRTQKGVLEARLVERNDAGFCLYDEVGANIVADRVPGSL